MSSAAREWQISVTIQPESTCLFRSAFCAFWLHYSRVFLSCSLWMNFFARCLRCVWTNLLIFWHNFCHSQGVAVPVIFVICWKSQRIPCFPRYKMYCKIKVLFPRLFFRADNNAWCSVWSHIGNTWNALWTIRPLKFAIHLCCVFVYCHLKICIWNWIPIMVD